MINQLSAADFENLMSHVAEMKSNADLLADDSLATLKESLGLEESKWNLLIQCLNHIFKHSLKYIFKPTTLEKQLEDDLKFHTEKAKEFVKHWSLCTKKDFGDLDKRYKLEDVTWQLNVEAASSVCKKEVIPNARIQLKLSKIKTKKKEDISLQLNSEELVQLYNTLENMQMKLDALGN